MSQTCPGKRYIHNNITNLTKQNLVISITMSQTHPAALSENIDNLQVVHPFRHPRVFQKYRQLDAA